METVRLVTFLSESAADLVHRAEGLGAVERGPCLDEAAELLALAANVMARHAAVVAAEEKVRRAA